MCDNNKYGYFDNDKVRVQITDSKDGVFITVDFKTLDNFDEYEHLGYRLWATNSTNGIKVETYEYYNQVSDETTFPSHRFAD